MTAEATRKRALITGITGQDGSCLAELLLGKGYEVHGIIRCASTFNTHRIEHLYQDPHEPEARLFLTATSPTPAAWSPSSTRSPPTRSTTALQPHVRVSFDEPEYTGNTTGVGTTRLLEAIRMTGTDTRFYQASSSEMFGASPPPQNEDTPFYPRSPYGATKVYGHWIARNYRDAHDMYAVNSILFNHESWQFYVKFEQAYLRPTDVDSLIGDPSRAHGILGRKAQVLPPELARIMVDAEYQLVADSR